MGTSVILQIPIGTSFYLMLPFLRMLLFSVKLGQSTPSKALPVPYTASSDLSMLIAHSSIPFNIYSCRVHQDNSIPDLVDVSLFHVQWLS